MGQTSGLGNKHRPPYREGWRSVSSMDLPAGAFTGVKNTLFFQKMRFCPSCESPVTTRGTENSQPFTFTGKERDRETGFSYFGARYYDSDLSGLFLSVDPMSDKYPNISPYAYCAWNPIILKDPNGMIIDSATLTQEIKDLTNPESNKYNSDFSDIIQKLNYDPTTLFRFCNWDEPQIDEKRSRIINGELQCAGKDGDIWVADICYVSDGDKRHRNLFEETYHAYQLLTGDIGFAHTIKDGYATYGVIGLDAFDEIDAKNWALNISKSRLGRFLGIPRDWNMDDLRENGYLLGSNRKTALDAYNDYYQGSTNRPITEYDKNGWIKNIDFHFRKQ